MSKNGLLQLRKLTIFYCKWGGSSKGMRDYISSDLILNFKNENPKIELNLQHKANRHPYVKGEYIEGRYHYKDGKQHPYTITAKNKTKYEIEEIVEFMKNKWGQKSKKFVDHYKVNKHTIQGYWNPQFGVNAMKHNNANSED
eukprot:TRINITY_DN37715_c1_g1_i3.p1 TRINITY_DN37715_c1_g1~~TRINITY_DN37715_c1_g1_i3.p1  ORF type:complete len:142 (-),score=13.01 TRINITY_DN37715_c1_g1_i3:227-652(-)